MIKPAVIAEDSLIPYRATSIKGIILRSMIEFTPVLILKCIKTMPNKPLKTPPKIVVLTFFWFREISFMTCLYINKEEMSTQRFKKNLRKMAS